MPPWSPLSRRAIAVALTLPVALLVITVEFFFSLLILFLWAGAMLIFWRASRPRETSARSVEVRWSAVTMLSLMIGGCLAPGKRIDRLLDRPVSLSRNAFTVAELNEEAKRWDDPAFPVWITFPEEGVAAHTVRVTFPRRDLTLREFVDEVESQTGLHHHFGGCGNAYTIVDGPAYNFGLSFLPPAGEREYDVGGMKWVRPGDPPVE